MDKEFEHLIDRYINQSSSVDELKRILVKLNDPKNISIFKSFIKANFFSIYSMKQSDTDDIIREVKRRIKEEENKTRKIVLFKKFLKYAAIFVVTFSLGYFSKLNIDNKKEIQKIIPKKYDIVLSADDQELVIEKDRVNENEVKKNYFEN